jgi:hypothetical protein
LSIPQVPIELSSYEKAELERQNLQAQDNSRFHDHLKCGEPLIARNYHKRHTKFHRQFCAVHQVIVNMSGWEIGWFEGDDLRAMNKVQWIQKKHRFNNS